MKKAGPNKRNKLVLILVVLFSLALIALGVFVATFDADRYRPLVVEQLEGALGRPVSLQKITLRWKGGIAAELRGLAILEDRTSGNPPLVEAGSVNAFLKLLPLLKGDLQIGSLVIIAPRARVIRHPDGSLEVPGVFPLPNAVPAPAAPAGGPAASPAAAPAAAKTQAVPLLIRELEIQEGVLAVSDRALKPPLELLLDGIHLEASVDLRAEKLTVRNSSAKVGGGTVYLSGEVQGFNAPRGKLSIKLERVRIESLAPAPAPGQAGLSGAITSSFDIQLNGQPPDQMLKGLQLQGKVQLDDGRLSNMNLLREVFNRLTIIPGLTDTLLSRLPPDYAQKLNERDTLLKPVDLDFTFDNGTASVPDLRVATDTFELAGSGRFGLDGRLDVNSQIFVNPDLTAALVRSVEELRFLADSQGRLVLPVQVGGNIAAPAIGLDMQYFTSKLLSNQGAELIGGLLNKVLEDLEEKD